MTTSPVTPSTPPPSAPVPSAAGPNAAPRVRRITAQAGFEAKEILRNGEQLMVTLLLPLIALVLLTQTTLIEIDTDGLSKLDFMAPGIMAMAIMSASFTSQAISTAFDRRNGVLRFLSTTPLGRGGLLGAKIFGVLAVELVQLVVIGAVAFGLGWRPSPVGLLLGVLVALLGTAAFTALALLMAGTMRAEGVLALSNILLILLVVGGAILVPASHMPGILGPLAQILPSGALGEAMRAAFNTGTIPLTSAAVLAGWALVLGWAANRSFKWH